MNFLACVNRILRANGQIRGDTDEITAFTDTQHNASINIAILAVQDELGDLVSDRLIPYERRYGDITLSSGSVQNLLEDDFVRFYGTPFFYNAAQNRQIFEYPGGLDKLRLDVPTYTTQTGAPNWWYFNPGAARYVAFFPVPGAAEDGQEWTYDYEASVMVDESSDLIPLYTVEETYAFAQMAGRRFKFMFENVDNKQDIQAVLDGDMTYRRAKARLLAFMVGKNPGNKYNPGYV